MPCFSDCPPLRLDCASLADIIYYQYHTPAHEPLLGVFRAAQRHVPPSQAHGHALTAKPSIWRPTEMQSKSSTLHEQEGYMLEQASHWTNTCTLSLHRFPDIPYIDPAPLPKSVPQVDELGVTSAPLKSAAFFIGAHCKPYNGELPFDMCTGVYSHAHIYPRSASFTGLPYASPTLDCPFGFRYISEDFMLCKSENRDPEHCLKEGRRVTRCARDLCVQYCLFDARRDRRCQAT